MGRKTRTEKAKRFADCYSEQSVAGFYQSHAATYVNPHEKSVQTLVKAHCAHYNSVIDLACGRGEVTKALACDITGLDPYTAIVYTKETGKPALELDFHDIASGKLTGNWDAAIISFAIHLVPKEILSTTLYYLTRVTNALIVISPTSKDFINGSCYWELSDYKKCGRTHFRRYNAI
jgi:hypothetical protein